MSVMDSLKAAVGWLGQKGRAALNSVTPTDNRPTWPPEHAHERLRIYQRNADLYYGRHEQVFVKSGDFKYTYDDSREYLAVNYLGSLTDLLISRLLGGGITVKAPQEAAGSEEFLQHLYHRCQLERKNYEAGLQLSYLGETLYKVRYDAQEQRVAIDQLSPALWFPEYAPLDGDKLIAANIGTVLEADRDKHYLWIERHELRDERSWVVNKLFRLDGDGETGLRYDPAKSEVPLETLPATEGLLPEVPTGIDDLLLVHITQGRSDYYDLLTIQGDLNHRLTQREEVLDKHVDPILYGPKTEDDPHGVDVSRLKYLWVDPGASAPVGMVTWDAQLTAVENALKELREDFATTAGIDLQAMRSGETGGPVSGRALRLGQMKTQDRVLAKQKMLGPGLQRVFSIATKLATASTVKLAFKPTSGAIQPLTPEDVVVEFPTGLPTLRIEEIEEQQGMLDAGVQSRVRAVMELHGVDRADAEQIIAEIDAEQQAAAPVTGTATLRTPLFSTLEPGNAGGV